MSIRLQVEQIGQVNVVRFLDKNLWDQDDLVDHIKEQLYALVDEGKKEMLLNFEGVEWLSESMYGALVGLRKILKQNAGKLLLCNINEHTLKTLKRMQLIDFFGVKEGMDQKAALLYF